MSTTPTAIDIARMASEHYGIPATEVLSIMKTPMSPASLRDEFAGRAMQTLLSTEYTSEQVSSEGWPRELAHEAYWIADAMLTARTEPTP